MKRFSTFLFISFLFIPFFLKAQNSIQLITIGDLSSIDLGAIYVANGLSGQPRFFQLIMNTQPIGRNVYLAGSIEWKENLNSEYKQIANFTTTVFSARNIFSDELGSSDIKFDKIDGDKDLVKRIAELGKPKGALRIKISMFAENGEFLDDDVQELLFSNPSQTISIIQPQNNSQQDLGNVVCSWTPVNGAISYKIKANFLENENQSLEEALNSSNPIINDYDVGNSTTVNLSEIKKNREWKSGDKIVVLVKAIINESGSLQELNSEPVVFSITGGIENIAGNKTPNPDLHYLAKTFPSFFPSELIEKINNGELQPDQIQIYDADGNIISFNELKEILSNLESDKSLLINFNFQPK